MTAIMSIFEKASRKALRFASNRGALMVEQLWNLPLQSKGGFDLDTIAKEVNAELKSCAEESFVSTSTNPLKAELELKLEILKHIIQVRQDENAARLESARKVDQRQKVLEIINRKQEKALEELPLEELQKLL